MNTRFKPNLYLVGVPKAATSALAGCLSAHPEVAGCRIKEPNFHCRDFNLPGPKTEPEYLSLFEVSPKTKYLLDASVLNLYSREAADSIARYADDPKIVIILRNPVEVMYSWHAQMLYSANETIQDFEAALAAESDRKAGKRMQKAGTTRKCPELLFYRNLTNYAEQIERYFETFNPEQIHIAFYEDFKADPQAVFDGIAEFLALDPSFKPDFRVSNASTKGRRSWRFHYLLKRAFSKPARALLSSRMRMSLIEKYNRLNHKTQQRKPLEKDLRKSLIQEAVPNIQRLSALVSRDLQHWCS